MSTSTFEIRHRWVRRYKDWSTRIGLGVSFERRDVGTARHYDFSVQLLMWNGNIVVIRHLEPESV